MSKHNSEKKELLLFLLETIDEVIKNTIELQNQMHEPIQKQFELQVKHRGLENNNRVFELFQEETQQSEKISQSLIEELKSHYRSQKQKIEHMSTEELEKTHIEGKNGFKQLTEESFYKIISDLYPKIAVSNRIDRILSRIHHENSTNS